jgi:hypothetical protein
MTVNEPLDHNAVGLAQNSLASVESNPGNLDQRVIDCAIFAKVRKGTIENLNQKVALEKVARDKRIDPKLLDCFGKKVLKPDALPDHDPKVFNLEFAKPFLPQAMTCRDKMRVIVRVGPDVFLKVFQRLMVVSAHSRIVRQFTPPVNVHRVPFHIENHQPIKAVCDRPRRLRTRSPHLAQQN